MTREITLYIVLLFFVNQSFGQSEVKIENSKLVGWFYNIPIDSCLNTIVDQAKKINDLKEISRNETFNSIIFKVINLWKESKPDSILIKVSHFPVAIGGSPNLRSPIQYEHWATKSCYFKDKIIADFYFKDIKRELDKLPKRFTPIEIQKNNRIEIVYSLPLKEREVTYQIHYSLENNDNNYIVEIGLRKIFNEDYCN